LRNFISPLTNLRAFPLGAPYIPSYFLVATSFAIPRAAASFLMPVPTGSCIAAERESGRLEAQLSGELTPGEFFWARGAAAALPFALIFLVAEGGSLLFLSMTDPGFLFAPGRGSGSAFPDFRMRLLAQLTWVPLAFLVQVGIFVSLSA